MFSGGSRNFFVGGIEGRNVILRGQKFTNLPKMADLAIFFLVMGAEPPTGGGGGGGGQMPPCPIDAATVYIVGTLDCSSDASTLVSLLWFS